MSIRFFFSLLISICLISIPCQAMDDREPEDYPPFVPTFQAAINKINPKTTVDKDQRDSHLGRRLAPLHQVYQRDSILQQKSINDLARDVLFGLTVYNLLALDESKFKKLEKRLGRQEKFSPLTSFREFSHFISLLNRTHPIIEDIPRKERPCLRALNAPSIDALARALTQAKIRTPEGENIGFICDTYGVLTQEREPWEPKYTRRTGINFLFDQLSRSRGIHFVATSDCFDSTLIPSLQQTQLDRYFQIPEQPRIETLHPSVILSSNPGFERKKEPTFIRLGLLATAQDPNWRTNQPEQTQKGLALATCYLNVDFSTIVIADDNDKCLVAALESFMKSRLGPTVKRIYLVKVEPASETTHDKLQKSTVEGLKAAFKQNKTD